MLALSEVNVGLYMDVSAVDVIGTVAHICVDTSISLCEHAIFCEAVKLRQKKIFVLLIRSAIEISEI